MMEKWEVPMGKFESTCQLQSLFLSPGKPMKIVAVSQLNS